MPKPLRAKPIWQTGSGIGTALSSFGGGDPHFRAFKQDLAAWNAEKAQYDREVAEEARAAELERARGEGRVETYRARGRSPTRHGAGEGFSGRSASRGRSRSRETGPTPQEKAFAAMAKPVKPPRTEGEALRLEMLRANGGVSTAALYRKLAAEKDSPEYHAYKTQKAAYQRAQLQAARTARAKEEGGYDSDEDRPRSAAPMRGRSMTPSRHGAGVGAGSGGLPPLHEEGTPFRPRSSSVSSRVSLGEGFPKHDEAAYQQKLRHDRKQKQNARLGLMEYIPLPTRRSAEEAVDNPIMELRKQLKKSHKLERKGMKGAITKEQYGAHKAGQKLLRKQELEQEHEALKEAYDDELQDYERDSEAYSHQKDERKYRKWADKEGKDWNDPKVRTAYAGSAADRNRINFDKKVRSANVDTSSATFGPAWAQESRKAAVEMAGDQFNKKYKPYLGKRIADQTEEEKKANKYLDKSSPFKASAKKKHKEIEEMHRKGANTTEVSRFAQPHLAQAGQNSMKLRTQYKNAHEDEVIRDLEDRSNRDFKEHLGELMGKYARPGLRRHGHMGKELAKQTEAHRRALSGKIAEVRHGGFQSAIEAAQTEKAIAGKTAHTAGLIKSQELNHRESGAHQLESLHARRRADKHHHSGLMTLRGEKKEARQQRRLDVGHETFKEERDYPAKQLANYHTITANLPISTSTASATAGPRPVHESPYSMYGAAALGMGQHGLERAGRKKGGPISRLKRASGGLMAEAVQNAVIDHDDPLNALNRLVKHKMGVEMLEGKMRARKALKSGGEVSNPIAKGAEQAKHYALQDEMLEHSNRMMNPPKEDALYGYVDAAMRAMGADTDSKHYLAKAGRAWTEGSKSMAEKRKNQHEREMQALGIKSKVAHSRQQDEKDARNFEAAERHHNRSYGLQERNYALQEQRNKIALNQHDALLDLKRQELEYKKSKKDTGIRSSAASKKLEFQAKKDLNNALNLKKELESLKKLNANTTTGPIVGAIKSRLPETKTDNRIRTKTNKIILDVHQGMKNIPRSEEFLKRLDSTKVNVRNHPEANNDAIESMGKGANTIQEENIHTLLDLGWTPKRIEKEFKIKLPPEYHEGYEDSDHKAEHEHSNLHDELAAVRAERARLEAQ